MGARVGCSSPSAATSGLLRPSGSTWSRQRSTRSRWRRPSPRSAECSSCCASRSPCSSRPSPCSSRSSSSSTPSSVGSASLGALIAGLGAPGGVLITIVNGQTGILESGEAVQIVLGMSLILMLIVHPNGAASLGLWHRAPWRRAERPRSAALGPPARDPVPPKTLEVQGLGVRFGGVQALDDVWLTVGAGEVVGLIGPNGAGKTTFIDAVTGFVPASGQWCSPVRRSSASGRRARWARSQLPDPGLSSRSPCGRTCRRPRIVGRPVPTCATWCGPAGRSSRDERSRRSRSSSSSLTWTSVPGTCPTATAVWSASHGRWRRRRRCSCSMSLRPAWTSCETLDPDASSADWRMTGAWRCCSWSTTCPWSSTSAIASPCSTKAASSRRARRTRSVTTSRS